MRIRLTHTFNDRQLKAIARVSGSRKKRKATRTECVQFVTQAVERAAAEAVEMLARFQVEPDPSQMLLIQAKED